MTEYLLPRRGAVRERKIVGASSFCCAHNSTTVRSITRSTGSESFPVRARVGVAGGEEHRRAFHSFSYRRVAQANLLPVLFYWLVILLGLRSLAKGGCDIHALPHWC